MTLPAPQSASHSIEPKNGCARAQVGPLDGSEWPELGGLPERKALGSPERGDHAVQTSVPVGIFETLLALRCELQTLPVPVLASPKYSRSQNGSQELVATGQAGEARESTPSSTNDAKLGSLTEGESRNSRGGQFISEAGK